jgi:hypothetical protein
MAELTADAFRTVGPVDAIPDCFDHLYASDDLCACAGPAAAALGW